MRVFKEHLEVERRVGSGLSASGLEEETKKPHSMLGLLLRVLYTTNEKVQLCKFNYVVFVYFCKDRLICFFVGIEILSR